MTRFEKIKTMTIDEIVEVATILLVDAKNL